ncbi:MAG: hypothetical protein COW30_18880 [Rhodospirillales bacterium CG15_BIG_FIL_POST_REV_8_21_14_020_66_15]|nr:MAG: hypothetical protein COW30_18880 [Rhodospirillales bacterium CG15_BIG_FIL_POST_REV_8_21_14_020_66_15]
MNTLSPEKVCFILIRMREFEAQEDVVEPDPGSNPIDDGFRGTLEAYADDPTFEEVKTFIDGLNEDEQAELVALAWIGREDYAPEDWDRAVRDAAERHTKATSAYVLGMPMLPSYLEAGLNQFGHSCDEFEV